MKRILLIKLTSLGDLIHALPAISDAYSAMPDIRFNWVIDENFQEVASWHPAVDQIFTTNHRQWRHGLLHRETYAAIFQLAKKLRKNPYDLVIDGQGNFKTALLSLLMKAEAVGFDKHSVRERIAHLAYKRGYCVTKAAHAVDRLRQLFALALDYPCPTTAPDFQILRERFKQPAVELPSPYIVFVHSASWVTKLWPEEHWRQLIEMTLQKGYHILLPWGNTSEEARAKRLAIAPNVHVLPRLSLSEMGYVIARARACVCMDTGLSHLTAALNVPSITLYGATDSGLIGANGENQLHIQSKLECAPCNKKECRFPCSGLNPPCLAQIRPDTVFHQLQQIIV